jgi:hypothetical protein
MPDEAPDEAPDRDGDGAVAGAGVLCAQPAASVTVARVTISLFVISVDGSG